jgi:hypothetical protein
MRGEVLATHRASGPLFLTGGLGLSLFGLGALMVLDPQSTRLVQSESVIRVLGFFLFPVGTWVLVKLIRSGVRPAALSIVEDKLVAAHPLRTRTFLRHQVKTAGWEQGRFVIRAATDFSEFSGRFLSVAPDIDLEQRINQWMTTDW